MAENNENSNGATIVTPQPESDIEILRTHLKPKYSVEKKLGSGGMADVYLGFHNLLKRNVAIKVLPKVFTRDEGMVGRFLREAESAAQLDNPGIISIYDIGVAGPLNYFIMAYVPGGTLKGRLTKAKKLDVKTAGHIIMQTCRALQYAHEKGVVHRDIKPDNIMFDERDNAVLTDFGIAKAKFASKMTATGTLIGTPHYMSPEQLKGLEVDGRSDIYSLGIVFYEILTGRVPFEGDDTYSVGLKHIQEPPEPPINLNKAIPKPLNDLILTMLAKTPEARFKKASDVEAVLQELLEGRVVKRAAGDSISEQAQQAEETWKLQRTQVEADFARMRETLGEAKPGVTPPPLDKVEENITAQQEAPLRSTPPPLTSDIEKRVDTPLPRAEALASVEEDQFVPGLRRPRRNLKPLILGIGAAAALILAIAIAIAIFSGPSTRRGSTDDSNERLRTATPASSPLAEIFQGRNLLFIEDDNVSQLVRSLEEPQSEPMTLFESQPGVQASIVSISYSADTDRLLTVQRDGRLSAITLSGRRIEEIFTDPLGEEAGIRQASWSPNGNYITFFRRQDDRYQLMVIPTAPRAASLPRPVFEYPGEIISPVFSPVDNRKITFVILDESLKKPSIIVLKELGQETWSMLYETDGRILNLAWAPDGRSLAFSLLLSGSSSIHLFDLDTESSRRLTDEGMNDTDPIFSPDGDHVIFTSDRETGRLGLWAVPREGGSPVRISIPSYANKRIVPLGWSSH